MDFNKLRSCETLKEVVIGIFEQSYLEYNKGKTNNTDIYGCYLRAKKEIYNTHFDTLFSSFEEIFLRVMEERDNEEMRRDSAVLMLEVLNNYVDGKYSFKWKVKTVDEFIDLIEDIKKSEELGKYLCGVAKRLASNMLYQTKSRNAYSQKKFWYHTYDTGKQVNTYVYNNYFYLDKKYSSSSTGVDVLERENFVNGRYEEIEQRERDNLMTVLYNEVLTEAERKRISKKLDGLEENVNVNVYKSVVMKRIENQHKFNTVNVVDDRVIYAGDFLSFGYKLMRLNDLLEKFNYIANAIERNTSNSEIIIDIITDLDTEIYVQFFQHIKDSRYAKYYVRSDNFKIILDAILNEYIQKQKTLREIYLYNESERRRKIAKIIELIESQKEHIVMSRLFDDVVELFGLKEALNNTKHRSRDEKINVVNRIVGRDVLALQRNKIVKIEYKQYVA